MQRVGDVAAPRPASASRRPCSARAAAAAAKPAMPGTFSNPPRRARSCSPPTWNGSTRRLRRTTKAPMPGGPPSLWALTDTRSAPSASIDTGTWPAAAQASTCTRAPCRWATSAISATGCTVPTSWLASWQCTRPTAVPSAASAASTSSTASGWSRPNPSQGARATGAARAEASRTEECSTSAHTTVAPGWDRVALQVAVLTASVPPEVKTTWRGRTPNNAATASRLDSTRVRAARPSVWTRPGSPVCSGAVRSQSVMAAATSGRGGEVEAWSR